MGFPLIFVGNDQQSERYRDRSVMPGLWAKHAVRQPFDLQIERIGNFDRLDKGIGHFVSNWRPDDSLKYQDRG
jgi:hypothetical protein